MNASAIATIPELVEKGQANRNSHRSVVVTILVQALLSTLVLLLVCNWHAIYEEDQMAKTAEVIYLGSNSNWRHFSAAPDYYSRDFFSAYYLAATAFYKLSRLPALESLNLFSVLCGVVFLTVMPIFLRRAFELSEWLSWLVLVSAPILIVTFNYGNEAALAITLTALSALALTFDSFKARVAAAFFYVLAAYSRSDYLFLWPALVCLTLVRNEKGMDWKRSLRNAAPFTAAAAILGVLYLALVVRKLPQPEYLNSQRPWKLFVAYFAYSPNLVTAFFALIGMAVCVAKRRFKYLLLLPVCFQFIPYIHVFNSPKYAVPTVVMIAIFGMLGMQSLWKRMPLAVGVLLALPWLISITPFGVFGPARSVFWYVPTDDGPLPTGGFLAFYARVKQGFYQHRYDEELKQIAVAMPQLKNPSGGKLAGHFNPQAAYLWAAWNNRWDLPTDELPFRKTELSETGTEPDFMLRLSYLYGLKQSVKLRAQLAKCCKEGSVKAVSGEAVPLPDVIQCGPSVVDGTDVELGRRILFMNSYFEGNQVVEQKQWLKDFHGVGWISRSAYDKAGLTAKILYSDSHWVCVAEDAPNAIFYSMRFPLRYAGMRGRVTEFTMKKGASGKPRALPLMSNPEQLCVDDLLK